MKPASISPARIRQFGDPEDAAFCLVTNREFISQIHLEREGGYSDYLILEYENGDRFSELLAKKIPEHAHILVISPNAFFQSPRAEELGSRRKLLAMACNSTPTAWDMIPRFLKIVEDTDPEEQQRFTDRFFAMGEASAYLEFVDERYGTRARLEHLDERYLWNEQAGLLNWGGQQLAPSGEISVLPLHIWDFDSNLYLKFNGTIAIQGYPILHNGTPSFLRADQARIHGQLACLSREALIATVENGRIVDLKAAGPEAQPAHDMMTAMFEVDSRYRIIWELGFAINTHSTIVPGNFAMNEVFGAENGTIHFGLGLTPHTQYHLDLICPGLTVLTDKGQVVLGRRGPVGAMPRVRAEGCACLE
ncbi:hypothetical protein CYFUS_005711 [Cystobacter fuscus]|uniref:Leucyl aminopeptidase (Aminopeptidase T) n=1 Tax=Cystobacter fuscus TaxID=43 RepID=A0A250J9L4_9BACT|nr:hypothetical protein [Cystobacter fuscus]ATB40263.1 hypothetical protein CYFUS_005711 [Cystobacter fuscus]